MPRICITLLLGYGCLFTIVGCSAIKNGGPKNAILIPDGAVIVDVRTTQEFRDGHVRGAKHIPIEELESGVGLIELNPQSDIVLYCKSGNRAGRAKQILEAAGFKNVQNGGGYADVQRALAER